MIFRDYPLQPDNPIVFFDIAIGPELVGRMIIELRKDVAPKTVENFRQLCTGEAGLSEKTNKPLCYKGTKFHKVQRVFMAQGGDIVRNDGTSGESIYGPIFDDENFLLKHDAGVVSMANRGRPNTNNSQFFITSVESSHLDGVNVVFGKVLRGFGILSEMEKYASDEAIPQLEMIIIDCGQLTQHNKWNYWDIDITNDDTPPFPMDWHYINTKRSINEMCNILCIIKNAGNLFFTQKQFVNAGHKYKKGQRYYAHFMSLMERDQCEEKQLLTDQYSVICLNHAATEIKLKNFDVSKNLCEEVLKLDTSNIKAIFRHGQSQIGLKNYDEGLKDFGRALQLMPNSKSIQDEYNLAKGLWKNYHDHQKEIFKNLFTK